jgi:hypothetical protein
MGNRTLAAINSGYVDSSQRGTVAAGRICGIIGTVVLIVGIVYLIVAFAFGVRMIKQAGSLATMPAQTGSPSPVVSSPAGNLKASSDPVMDALLQHDDDKLAAALDKDPSVINRKSAMGRTPLFDAVFFGTTKTVSLFIARGANVNAQDDFGERPLDVAHTFHKDDVAALLVSKGAIAGKKQ